MTATLTATRRLEPMPDLLAIVQAELRQRSRAELMRIACEVPELSFEWLYKLQRDAYRHDPRYRRLVLLYQWLVEHPLTQPQDEPINEP